MTDSGLLQRLLLIEKSLTASIKGFDAAARGLPSEGELRELKSILDRIRPLVWIYLARRDGRPTFQSDSVPILTK